MKIKRKLFLSVWMVTILIFVGVGWVEARPPRQEEVPTLPVELYSYTATPGLDGGIRHVVLDGQFLYNIVDLYGISLNEILTLNNLTAESVIHPGDILVIVEGSDLFLQTLTPQAEMVESTPMPTPTEDLISLLVLPEESEPEAAPEEELGFFQRVFSSNAKFLALGVLALVAFGVVLLVISYRRMQ